jgi:hypothetical protein
MPITSFKDKLIVRLENERIRKPERILNETYFEQLAHHGVNPLHCTVRVI